MAIFCSLQTVELSECNLLRGTFRSTSSATNHKLFLGCQILSGLVFILIFRAPKIGREKNWRFGHWFFLEIVRNHTSAPHFCAKDLVATVSSWSYLAQQARGDRRQPPGPGPLSHWVTRHWLVPVRKSGDFHQSVCLILVETSRKYAWKLEISQSVFHFYLFSAEKLRTAMDMSRAIPNRLENERLTQFGSTCHGWWRCALCPGCGHAPANLLKS